MEEHDDLSDFISNTRMQNLQTAKNEALRIHQKIDFKKYISDAIRNSQQSVTIELREATWTGHGVSEPSESLKNWEDEYIHCVSELFAGEETWSSIWAHFVEIVESQGISCSLIYSGMCKRCGHVKYNQPIEEVTWHDEGVRYISCHECATPEHAGFGQHREAGRCVTQLRIFWE